MDPSALIRRLEDSVDPSSRDPISHQVTERIWLEVVQGTLPTGSRLPTTRELGIALGISPRSVARAYESLERLGVTATRVGEGTFVSLTPPPDAERRRRKELAELCREAVDRAREIGFSLDDLLEALAEFRGAGEEDEDRRPRRQG